MALNLMCHGHKDNRKYRDKYDAIFRKKDVCYCCGKEAKYVIGKDKYSCTKRLCPEDKK